MEEVHNLNGAAGLSSHYEDDQRQGQVPRTNAPSGLIDIPRCRFPNCIVWSPLPVITWFLPFIGHTGICDSDGVIWDFAGPYTIGREHMAFGTPTRYIQLDPTLARAMSWNDGVREANKVYSKRMHNICCDNCHSHVANALNAMEYVL